MHFNVKDLETRDPAFRRNFFNSLPGPRGVHLIGTKGHRGTENLGVFSSVVHLGASPALLGFMLRPLTVPRHTYHHIKATGWFTLNTLHPEFLNEAHQTSANYGLKDSEFAATGLTPEYSELCPAPYVAESQIRIGLTFEEEHRIAANDTFFVVGRIQEIFLPEGSFTDSGHVDHAALETLTVAGLDTYFRPGEEERFDYARP